MNGTPGTWPGPAYLVIPASVSAMTSHSFSGEAWHTIIINHPQLSTGTVTHQPVNNNRVTENILINTRHDANLPDSQPQQIQAATQWAGPGAPLSSGVRSLQHSGAGPAMSGQTLPSHGNLCQRKLNSWNSTLSELLETKIYVTEISNKQTNWLSIL